MCLVCFLHSRISIHAAREGGDGDVATYMALVDISIHAAREGGDLGVCDFASASGISIHAAREGGDGKAKALYAKWDDFNPRRP